MQAVPIPRTDDVKDWSEYSEALNNAATKSASSSSALPSSSLAGAASSSSSSSDVVGKGPGKGGCSIS